MDKVIEFWCNRVLLRRTKRQESEHFLDCMRAAERYMETFEMLQKVRLSDSAPEGSKVKE